MNNEQPYWLRRMRPRTWDRSTAIIQFIQSTGVPLALIGSTLAHTWPGRELYGRKLNKAWRANSELADAFGIPLVPPTIELFGLEQYRKLPTFRVHIVRRASPANEGWIATFYCPWCNVEHQHHWLPGYHPTGVYHRSRELECRAVPLESGYYIKLDRSSREFMEKTRSLEVVSGENKHLC